MPKLPTSWKKISLKTYVELDRIIKDNTLNTSEKDIEVLALLFGKARSDILGLPFNIRHELLQKIQFLNNLDSIKPLRLSKGFRFLIKGRRFEITLNATELTGGQYIDLMTFLKDTEATNQNIHNILAVLAAPLKLGFIKTKYDGKDHEKRAAFFYENMPVSIAYPILVFFCNLSEHLTVAMQAYLKTETSKKMELIRLRMQDIMSATAGL